jgi:hypothetical protein
MSGLLHQPLSARWNFDLPRFFLRQTCRGTKYRDEALPGVSGGTCAPIFVSRLPSIRCGMRQACSACRRSYRQGPASGHGGNLQGARRKTPAKRTKRKGRLGYVFPIIVTRCLFSAAPPLNSFAVFRNDDSGRRLSARPVNQVGISMSLSIMVPESRRCRTRARECRLIAERLRVQAAREQMLKAASDFDRMAHDAEQREIEQGLSYLRALANGKNTAPR